MAENNLRFLTLADYVTPAKTENEKGGWVEYGDDNAFFDYLIQLYNNSATNNACIRGTANLIYGQGLEAVNSRFNLEGYVNLKTVFAANDVRNVCNDLKAFGMAAFEVLSEGATVKQALHLPMNYLRSGIADDEGKVREWFYATNWPDSDKPDFEATAMPVFGYHGSAKRSILIMQPYSFGSFYYSSPDYIGSLNWADAESEISQFHLSNLRNGMWPGMLINFNNGVPPEDDQIQIEKDVNRKWGKASKAGRVIIAFNRDKDSAATIEPVQLSDAAEQFKTVSDEAMQKILLGHRITSPMLLGIKENTGLGNNAEELKSAHALFINTVIKPMQDVIIEAVEKVLRNNGYGLNLYFKPLTPLEFKDYSIPLDSATQEKETGVQMSAVSDNVAEFMPDDSGEEWLTYLADKAEKVDLDEWELEYEEEVTDPEMEAKRTKLFARFADPEEPSPAGDSGLFKVRYRYSQNIQDNSRNFCKNMVANSWGGMVYRLEDINGMTAAKVNIGLSPADCKRCGYDIWLFKGGKFCHHRWVRQVYFRSRSGGKFLPKSKTAAMENDERVSVARAESVGVPQNKLEPKGWNQANTAPINTPSRGAKV